MDLDAFKEFLFLEFGWEAITWKKSVKRIIAAKRRGLVFEPWDPKAGKAYLLKRLEDGCTVFAFNSDVKLLNRWHQFKTGEERKFKPKRTPKSTHKFLTPEQVQRVLQYRHELPDVQDQRRALFLWAIKSGMRAGEVAAMDEDHVSLRDGKFLVAKPSKGGPRRWLPIERFVLSPKRPFMKYVNGRPRSEHEPKALWTSERYQGRMGPKGPARRLQQVALTRGLREMGKQAGLERLNFNVTRHTRGTELYRTWRDLLKVAKYLGHSNLQSTQVYAAIVDGDLDKEMRRRPGKDPFQGSEDDDQE